MVTSGEREGRRGNAEVGKEEVQNISYEINYKDILYNTGSIANFDKNCKWNVTFKNCESLCCTLIRFMGSQRVGHD